MLSLKYVSDVFLSLCFGNSIISDERAAKRVKLGTTALGDQAALDTEGAFVNVGQKKLAGFSAEESLLYVRSETVELWKALSDTGVNSLSIDGPPGTGKSTEAWAWALWKANEDLVTVTWYHLSKRRVLRAVIDGETKKITTALMYKIDTMEESEGSILIVDGVTKADSVDVSRACSSWRGQDNAKRFVAVSSATVVIAAEQDNEANIVNFTMGSWTFEQYKAACADEGFYEQVKSNMECPDAGLDKDQLLLAKYYFAGDCARWMFEFTYGD